MTTRLYYNPSSATGDPRRGMGYGKSQKIPSMGTGSGSESIMGSSETGIYIEPDEEDEESEEDLGFDDEVSIDKFINLINKRTVRADTAFWPRADRSSLGNTQSVMMFVNEKNFPKVSNSIAPLPHRTLYPNGFDGAPLGTGAANQAFRTTGPYKRTGTSYGTSRAPLPAGDEDDSLVAFNLQDILDMDSDERALLRQKIKVMKILNRLNEIDKESETLFSAE